MSRKPADNANIQYIAQRLRTLRIQRGASQEDLADIFGVTTQQVDRLEKGEQRLSLNHLIAAHTYFHVPMSYFFEGLDEQDAPSEQVLSRRALELASYYDEIGDSEAKMRIFNLVESFVRSTHRLDPLRSDNDAEPAGEPKGKEGAGGAVRRRVCHQTE